MIRPRDWLLPRHLLCASAMPSELIDLLMPIRLVPVVVIATTFTAVVFAVSMLRPATKARPAPAVFVLNTQDAGVRRTILPADSLFEFDDFVLKPGATSEIWNFAKDAKAMGKAQIMVIGHSDPLGSAARNSDLSLARARAVRDVLVDAGLDGALIGAAGLGSGALVRKREECPTGEDKDPKVRACLAPDRRVEMWIRDLTPAAAASSPASASSR